MSDHRSLGGSYSCQSAQHHPHDLPPVTPSSAKHARYALHGQGAGVCSPRELHPGLIASPWRVLTPRWPPWRAAPCYTLTAAFHAPALHRASRLARLRCREVHLRPSVRQAMDAHSAAACASAAAGRPLKCKASGTARHRRGGQRGVAQTASARLAACQQCSLGVLCVSRSTCSVPEGCLLQELDAWFCKSLTPDWLSASSAGACAR
jgi:hypothetical protein